MQAALRERDRALHRPRRRVHASRSPRATSRRSATSRSGCRSSPTTCSQRAARRRLLHEPRHVPGGADEARRRARDADAAPHARRHPRAGGRRSRATSRPRWSAAARPPSAATRRSSASRRPPLTLEHHRSAAALDAAEWDALLGERGTFTVDGLQFLERAFGGGASGPRTSGTSTTTSSATASGKAVLATFFTAALWKDDMMASAEVSELVEAAPRRGPVLPDVDDVRDGLAADRGRPPLPGPQRGLEGRAGPADGRRRPSTRRPRARGRSSSATCYSADLELAEAVRERGYVKTSLPDSLVYEPVAGGDEEWLAHAVARRRACTSASRCCRSTTPTTSSG